MKKNLALWAMAAMVVATTAFTSCDDNSDPEPVKVTGVTLSPSTAQAIDVGATVTITANVAPTNAGNKAVTWSATPAGIVTVTDGVVKGDAPGEATVKVTTTDGGFTAEVKVTVSAVVVPPAVTITPATGLSLTALNEIKYTEAVDEEGEPAKDLSVEVAANYGIGAITLKLITDAEPINAALTEMGLAEGFELGSMSAPLAGALANFLPGLPTGEEAIVGKDEVTLDFSAILPLVASIQGGVNQFDIEIKADGADDDEDGEADAADTKTLKLKFIDDVTVWGTIAGDEFDITEEQVIKTSEAATASRKIDITSLTGIENLLVDIDNPVIDEALALMNLDEEFDIANPDAALTASLTALAGMGLSLPSGDAVKTKTTLTLDLNAAFIGALVNLGEGTTAIKLTVKDAAGHAVTETLTITVVDDLKLEITGDGIGETPLEIVKSEATGETPTPVVVDIVAAQGIEKFMVKIESTSANFNGTLAAMSFPTEFDLANPGEELGALLAGIGLIDEDAPVKEATEVEFDITGFIPMIFEAMAGNPEAETPVPAETECTASFKLTITDGVNQTKSATIALKLVDDSATPPAGGGEDE